MLVTATITWVHWWFMIPLSLLSVFLILVILVQRGRGGGLTGALGGMGGQSAFGTKAGDLFTRITIIVAAIWVLLSMASLKMLNKQTAGLNPASRGITTPTAPAGGKATDLIPAKVEDKAGAPESAPATSPPAENATTPPANEGATAPASGTDRAAPSDSAKP